MNSKNYLLSFLVLTILISLGIFALAASTQGNAVEDAQDQTITVVNITIDTGSHSIPINKRVFGTNLPAWLSAERFENGTFQARTLASGVTIIRMPGGSWSNYYDWLACERDGVGIDADSVCYWLWASRPTDFINFIRATGLEGSYTVNMNDTAKAAAGLVAFFNGSVNDDRTIGVDVRGRDWGKVSDWAKLRRDNGNPEPVQVKYWEVGNEIYGGKEGHGNDCVPWGWEDVWTCDGREYVMGIGEGNMRREGYLEFREAMRAVDPTIQVGAVGVPEQSGFSNWGNEVIAGAGQEMDFYAIHQYGYFDPPASYAEALAQPQTTWGEFMADVRAAFSRHANGRVVPVAVTEHNLFSVQEQDNGQWMTRAVNMLYMADTIGQMLQHEFALANQWDLANGTPENGTDYGLLHADTYFRYPQYYVFPLWARFGDDMLPVTSSLPADTTLSVYAGRINDKTVSLLAINKTAEPLQARIKFEDDLELIAGLVDVVSAESLDAKTAVFNNNADPADDLSDAPSQSLEAPVNPLPVTFKPYSVTLLRLTFEASETGTPTPIYENAINLPFITAE